MRAPNRGKPSKDKGVTNKKKGNPGRLKNTKKPRYTKELQAKVMNLYKTGKMTIKDISNKYGMSRSTLCNWSTASLLDEKVIVQKLEQKYEDEFVKKGIDKTKIANIVAKFLEAEKEKDCPDFKVVKDGIELYMKLVGVGKEEIETHDKNVEVKILVNNASPTNKKAVEVDFSEINI